MIIYKINESQKQSTFLFSFFSIYIVIIAKVKFIPWLTKNCTGLRPHAWSLLLLNKIFQLPSSSSSLNWLVLVLPVIIIFFLESIKMDIFIYIVPGFSFALLIFCSWWTVFFLVYFLVEMIFFIWCSTHINPSHDCFLYGDLGTLSLRVLCIFIWCPKPIRLLRDFFFGALCKLSIRGIVFFILCSRHVGSSRIVFPGTIGMLALRGIVVFLVRYDETNPGTLTINGILWIILLLSL